MKNNNNMVYFILALMCVLIGGHLEYFYYSSTPARMLIGLGVFILLVLGIKSMRYLIAYSDSEEKDIEKEEFKKEE